MGVRIIGAAASNFGMFAALRLRDLAAEAVAGALADSGIEATDVGMVMFGNAAAGLLNGQEMIRAQTALSTSALTGLPMVSVENACASSSSAFHLAQMAIESGMHDVVAVVGAEKMTDPDRGRALRALATAVDVDARVEALDENGKPRAVFMELYAGVARRYMERSGATARDFAEVVAKNTYNGSMNPIAQIRTPISVEEVLAAREIVAPLTRPMCAGIGDGAAALILCSDKFAREHGLQGPRVLATMLCSGIANRPENIITETSRKAFAKAGVGPGDIDLVELHDAAAPAEVMVPEEIGLVAPGDGPKIVRDGTTRIGGRMPINPSGGLTARGHPIGATGAAQLVELTNQLRGRAGPRQVEGARIALAENAGGSMPGGGGAACVITILEAA